MYVYAFACTLIVISYYFYGTHMDIKPFTIEEFFSLYEFSTPHMLSASDCETLSVRDLLRLANMPESALLDQRQNYTESQGNPDLRAAISRLYQQVTTDEVIVLTAPEEGIYVTMRALLEPGDHVVVLTPAYESLLNLAEHITGNVSQWAVRQTADSWELDLAELERLVTADTKLLIVNFPHNPTGLLPSTVEFESIIAIARRHGTRLFCDEMYRGLERDPQHRLPSAIDRYDRAIILSGLSKIHGLPGLRSGWLVLHDDDLRERIMSWKYYTSICPPAPSELLAQAALQAHGQLVGRNRALIGRNLALAEEFFARWPDMFDWRPPQAGPVALVGVNTPSTTTYCHALAQQRGVLLLPSSCLGYGNQHVRFGFGRGPFAAALGAYEATLAEGWTPE
ncbi:MAG: aminotransferase class I/II-fold pyridoxal phosphate-dependent enzyme [Chloroflexota bacterium]